GHYERSGSSGDKAASGLPGPRPGRSVSFAPRLPPDPPLCEACAVPRSRPWSFLPNPFSPETKRAGCRSPGCRPGKPKPVVILLRNGTELVIVTTRASNGQPEKRRADHIRPFRQNFVPAEGDLGIARVAPHGAEPMKNRGGCFFVVIAGQFIASDL